MGIEGLGESSVLRWSELWKEKGEMEKRGNECMTICFEVYKSQRAF